MCEQQPLRAGWHSECNRIRLCASPFQKKIQWKLATPLRLSAKLWNGPINYGERVQECCVHRGSICRPPRMQFSFFGLFNWWLASPPLYAFYCYYYYSSCVQWFRCSLFNVVVVLDVYASFAARIANELANKTLCAVSTIKIPCHLVVWSSLLCALCHSMCLVCVCVFVSLTILRRGHSSFPQCVQLYS